MIKKGICVLFLCFSLGANGQKPPTAIGFELKYGDVPLQMDKAYVSAQSDTLSISEFRCYISGIECHYEDGSTYRLPNSYHLLELHKPESFRIPFKTNLRGKMLRVSFNIGIDSTMSTSGAHDGALDPALGMYWAWQSGYINMKIEGKSPSCPTRKGAFHFHLGGYKPPFYALRRVSLDCAPQNATLKIAIDLKLFFDSLKLSDTHSVMVPGAAAMQLSDWSATMFRTE